MGTAAVRHVSGTWRRAMWVVVLVALLTSLTAVSPAAAVIDEQYGIVSDDPAGNTPYVLDASARALADIGDTIYVGGYFQQVQDTPANGGTVFNQPYLFAFDRNSGAIRSGFRPDIDDRVESVAASADGQSIFVGGYFNTVDGQTRRRVVKLDATTGAVDPAFIPIANSRVNHVIQRNGRIFVAGNFSAMNGTPRSLVAELDPVTGATLGTVDHAFGAPHGGGALSIRSMDVSPDGSRLVAVGNFGTVDGEVRESIVQLDVSTTPSTLFDWQTSRYGQDDCFSVFDTYMKDVEFSPDGSYFAVATTGGGVRGTLCDTIARWETAATGSGLRETWANSSGGDTYWSVGVAGDVIYVGGHQRWVNNPFGRDFAGPGAVSREGVAVLDARNGMPFTWNPGRQRGVGLFDFLTGPEGLWAVSDTERWGAFEYHPRLARFPLQGGSQLPDEVPGPIPGTLVQVAPDAGVTNPGYLHRVNAGGPALGGSDGGIDWASDNVGQSPYRNSGSRRASWSPVPTVDGTVPSTTPSDIFASERLDPGNAPEMQWEFPVEAGTPIQVRLYFANRCTCTDQVGERIFDVAIDGATVLDDLDVVAVRGDDVGTMFAFDITSDGLVDIDFGHVTENPIVSGIEIVDPALLGNTPPGVDARLTPFDGTQSTGLSTDVAGSEFGGLRGAFMISGELFAALPSGEMTRQDFDGSTFSNREVIDLNGLTASEFPVSSLTGLTYDPITARILYTVVGSNRLHSRGFLPESGVVSAENVRDQASLAGVDWSQVRGLHLSPYDGHLYYGHMDGGLRRIDWDGAAATGSPTGPLSGPDVDGLAWSRGITAYAGDDIQLPNQVPTAAITATCDDGECSLSGIGSSDSDGEIASYAWDFGDGDTANGVTVDHTFAEGEWTVTLTVTDDDGATGQTTEVISFGSEPIPDLDASCIGLDCTFDGSGSSDAGEPVVAWDWTFGDGGGDSGEVVQHTYAAPGTYTVELTVTDDEGVPASTTVDVTVDELNEAISWVGSDSDTGRDFSFEVTVPADVRGGDLLMLFVSSSQPDIGNEAPTGVDGWVNQDVARVGNATAVVWSQVADGSEAGQAVTVDMEGVRTKADVTVAAWRGVDPDQPFLVSEVDVETVVRAAHTTPTGQVTGDGAWVVSYWTDRTSATTSWTAPQDVVVRHEGHTQGGGRASALLADSGGPVAPGTVGGLTATANSADYKATMWTFALAPSTFEPADQPPAAEATSSCTELSCSFDGSGSDGVDDAIVSWAWDFGDGNTATGENVSHVFAAAGPYTVELTVTDGQGLTDTTAMDVTVTAGPADQPPVADIASSCTELSCSFDGSGSDGVDDAIVSWAWDLGDGATDTGETVTHDYAADGSYKVSLTVTDGQGLTDTTTVDVTVAATATEQPPVADIAASCTELSCSFDGSGSSGVDDAVATWVWDFGDGNSDVGESVSHAYAADGTYTVELTVTDTQGLIDTTTVDVMVAGAPPPTGEISFLGTDAETDQLQQFEVTVPADVQADDLLVVFVSSSKANVGDEEPTGVGPWNRLDSLVKRSHTVTVWSRVADGTEAGETVTVDMEGQWTKADVAIAVWRGVDTVSPFAAVETVTRADHTTPTATAVDGAWAVSYWTDRTSSTTSWTAPDGVTVRHEGYTVGGGRATALLADSGGPVPAGTVGGLTATADSANDKATMWTLVLDPAG